MTRLSERNCQYDVANAKNEFDFPSWWKILARFLQITVITKAINHVVDDVTRNI